MRRIIIYWKKALLGALGAGLLLAGASCNSDDIKDEAMYTFTGETVASFCKNNANLTLFYSLIEKSGSSSLLSVYGHYTCFVPTNEAVSSYIASKGWNLQTITAEQALKIVYNSIIRDANKEYETTSFEQGSLPTPSLNDRFIVISFRTNSKGERETLVNKSSLLLSGDNEVHNGVVHVVDKVVEPSEESFLERLSQLPQFKVWAKLYKATGYNTAMEGIYDESYTPPSKESDFQKLKLGYTIFCEPDSLFAAQGIVTAGCDTLQCVERYAQQYYGSEESGNYSNSANALNRFVAYHLLNRQMSTSSFVYSGFTVASTYKTKSYEYYETMYKNHLMEIKAGNKINTRKDGTCVSLDDAASNIDVVNGFIHTLKCMMVYDEEVMTKDVLHKRIRFDFMAIPPQFTNNNIRWQLLGKSGCSVSPDFCGDYFTYNEGSTLTMWASDGWTNYQADEMLIKGPMYDFTFRMLPVPPGNYEIRLGYRAESWRGIAQLFIDGQIAGIPVDLTIGYNGGENDPRIGYVADAATADNGIENDKMMRNHGYMKAPNSIYTSQEGGKTLRDMSRALRIIIGQYSFDSYAPHYFRAKNMDDKGGGREFHADYLEYIPVDMIRDEDRE